MLKDCESVSQSVSEIIEYRAAASQLKKWNKHKGENNKQNVDEKRL